MKGKYQMNKLVITDDHFLIREGLVKVLQSESINVEVTDKSSSANELFKILKKDIPDVILLDIALQGTNDLHVLEESNHKILVMKPVCILPKINGHADLFTKEMKNGGSNSNGQNYLKIRNEI
jgi:DNA-binding NarL/FixJ family response regulator